MADEIQGPGRLQIATDMASNAYVVAKTALNTLSDLAMTYCMHFESEIFEKTSNQPTLLGAVFSGAKSLPSVAYSAGVQTYMDSQKVSDYINEVEEQSLLNQAKELDLGEIPGLTDVINDKTSTSAEKQNALAKLKEIINDVHVEKESKEKLKPQLEECKEYLQKNPDINRICQEKNSFLHRIATGNHPNPSSELMGKAIKLVNDTKAEVEATKAEKQLKEPLHLEREIVDLTDVVNKHDISLTAAKSRIFMTGNHGENSVAQLKEKKDEAEKIVFEGLCEKIKQNPIAQNRLASLSDEMRSIFENGISPDPSKTKNYIDLAEILLQEKVEVEGDHDEEIDELLDEFENFSDEKFVFEGLCKKIKQNPIAQDRLASQSDEVRSVFENGISPDPTQTKNYIELAEILLQEKIEVEGDHDEEYDALLNEFENFSDSHEIKPIATPHSKTEVTVEPDKERLQQRAAKVEEIRQKNLELEKMNIERQNKLAALKQRKKTAEL